MTGRAGSIGLLAAAACVLAPDAVSACGQCICDGEYGAQVFPPSSQSLPQNAVLHVWAPGHGVGAVRLVRHDLGTMKPTDVEIDVQPISDSGLFEVRARDLLEAGASYSLEVSGGASSYYQVRAGQDTTPPTLGGATGANAREVLAGYCGRKLAAGIELSDVADDDESDDRRVVRIDIDGVDRPLFTMMEHGSTVAVGRERETNTYAQCLGAIEIGEDAPAGSFSAQVSVLDNAGNASEPRTVHGLKLVDIAAAG